MSNSEKLSEHYGRNGIKVFKIVEKNVMELTTFSKKPLSDHKLFYPSTGSGNLKFSNKFSNTLVPFYGMEDDKDGTLIKAIMLRSEVYAERTLFKWQVDLLNNVKDDVEAELLDDFQLLLDNYFNTPGEMLVSIDHNEGFWKDNETLREILLELYKSKSYNITYKDITEEDILSSLLLFGKDKEQGFYHSEDDKLIGNLNNKELGKNWLDTLGIIEQKRQHEAIEKKLKKLKEQKKQKKQKKQKGGKSKKYKKVKKVNKVKKTKKKRVL
tara:strand:- start:55 stop:861 length:807 start_codon:yes stop_codon:yes gene_type:complete